MSVRTLSTSSTFTSDIETADMCSVSFIIRCCSLKLQNCVIRPHLSVGGFIIQTSSSLAVMFLGKIFPIDITLGNGIIGTDAKSSVSNLDRQTILEIQKAYLTYIFQFTASLANLCFLISCISTWSPTENSKRPSTDLTFLVILCSSHANIGIITEARFTDDREVGAFPAIGFKISEQAMRHFCNSFLSLPFFSAVRKDFARAAAFATQEEGGEQRCKQNRC